MNLIDLHCDTAFMMSIAKEELELRKNTLCVDLERMKEAGSMAQFFASFIHMKYFNGDYDKAYEAALKKCLQSTSLNNEIKLMKQCFQNETYASLEN